ncbi:uncharacterized protein LOC126752086 [Bactrocera neohumeralis]|uniref:uncharacterized protein LOC120767356 n=1 Tax=Bactrocera tryoni TaxID=59916 RepID=UPI001A957D7C|nr:uncharacterized protein LOC120767356 [Bactrocera tryoni]XP_050318605.1 uncharacterized protein LOC126752086 [Bactrocera neohumeralis]
MTDETASCIDIVREFIVNASKDFANTLGLKSNTTRREEKVSAPTSVRRQLLDVLITELCGHVTDDLRLLWYVSCDCYYDISGEEIKAAKKVYEDNWRNVYSVFLNTANKLNDDPYVHVELASPSKIQINPNISMREYLYSPIHIPGEDPIVVLGQNSIYISKADFDKICWRHDQGAARKLCALIFSRVQMLETDFKKTFLEPYKIADIESCVLTCSYSNSDDILKHIAIRCFNTHKRYRNKRIPGKKS